MKAYIKSLTYYLPEIIEKNDNVRLRKKTGIEQRHICPKEMTAGDMAQLAAEKLFSQTGIERNSIDFLLLCTQSPDYYLPTTACILQDKLNLSKNCGALDFNLGCSGFIYGLGLAKGLIESGQAKNILLLTSETYSKYINPNDNATKVLFGDAAAATLISGLDSEFSGISNLIYGTDGSGAKNLIVPVGGSKNNYAETKIETYSDDFGNIRTNRNLYMNGQEILKFTLDVVPELVKKILASSSNDINYYVFHQANKLILESLRAKCEIPSEKFYIDVKNGNTVSSSIAIALRDLLEVRKCENLKKVMLAGYGVGLSWGGCIVDLSEAEL